MTLPQICRLLEYKLPKTVEGGVAQLVLRCIATGEGSVVFYGEDERMSWADIVLYGHRLTWSFELVEGLEYDRVVDWHYREVVTFGIPEGIEFCRFSRAIRRSH